MIKALALVTGLHNVFNTSINEYGDSFYDFNDILSSALTNHNISIDTMCYVVTDGSDHDLGYHGSYICTRGEAYSTNQDVNGLFFDNNLIETSTSSKTAFIFGMIKPTDNEDFPWSINYHLEVKTSNSEICTESDVFIKGYKKTINAYYSNNNSNSPAISTQIVLANDDTILIGITMDNTTSCNTIPRSWCMKLNKLNRCNFVCSSQTLNLNDENISNSYIITYIDAKVNGFVEKSSNAYSKLNNMYLDVNWAGRFGYVYSRPKELYAFNIYGELCPLSCLSGSLLIPTNSKRDYTENIIDYSKGIYYTDDNIKIKDGSTKVDGCLYSSFSGIDFRYIDNIPDNDFDETKPLYIMVTTAETGETGIAIHVNNENVEELSHMWTLDPDNDEYLYWFVGYPLKKNNENRCYTINLFEENILYKYNGSQLVPYNSNYNYEFIGQNSSIFVSGIAAGTNSSSLVTITPTITSVSAISSPGELPEITYKSDVESLNLSFGSLLSYNNVSVWNGYSSAVAAPLVFTGSTVTFTGNYTPNGSILEK